MDQPVDSDKTEATFRPELETLSGDIRDFLLDRFRLLDKPWTKLSEGEQRRLISAADTMARQVVHRSARLIAHRGFPHIEVSTGKWTIDKGVKLEIGASSTTENIMKLAEHGKAAAILVLSEPAEFLGEREEAKADPDQPEMPLSEGERAAPDTGEVLGAGSSGGLPPEEAQQRFEDAKAADDAKKAGSAAKRAAKKAEKDAAASAANEAVIQRGRDAFAARQPGLVPDDIAGTPEADLWLQGWDEASVASAKSRDAAAPSREPVEA